VTHGSLEVAAARLEALARQRLRAPGLVVGLVGPGGWAHQFALGVADVASGRPLQTDALLPIASTLAASSARWPRETLPCWTPVPARRC
jgi:Beta-lactamase